MRFPLPALLTTFVIRQWTSAGSTRTTGNRTDVAARNVSAVSPSPEAKVSVESSRSQTQGRVTGKVSVEQGDQEERAVWSELPDARVVMGVEEFLSSLPLDLHTGSSEIKKIIKQTGMLVTHERLETWLRDFQTSSQTFRNDDLINALVHSGHGGALAELFLRLRGIDSLKSRAEAMQSALLEEYPDAFSKVSEVWLTSELNPKEAWSMLPVSVQQCSWKAASANLEWPAAIKMISHWLDYVDKYRALYRTFGDGQVIEVLAGNRRKDAVKELFRQLQTVRDTKHLQNRMLMDSTRRRQLTMNTGINSDPEQVFGTMHDFVVTKHQGSRRNVWSNELFLFEDWLDYVYKYRCQFPDRKFSDYQVIKVLTRHIEDKELKKMFYRLRNAPGMEPRANKMLHVLALQREFDQRLVQGLTPADVYSQMPIAQELDKSLPFLGKSRWPFILSMLEDWLEYVDQYRYHFLARKFSDYHVVKVLARHRPMEEVEEMFHRLRNVSGMGARANEMLHVLALQREFDQRLLQGLTPADVYDQMPIAQELDMSLPFPEKSRWPVVFSMLEDWLEYVEQYRYQFPDRKFSDYQLVKVLASSRPMEQVIDICHMLQKILSTKSRANKIFNAAVLQHKFDEWLVQGLSPAAVLPRMPIAQELDESIPVLDESRWPFVLSMLEDWLEYVDQYRYKFPARKFSDYHVVKVLARHRPMEEVEEMFHRLRNVSGMEARATKMLHVLALQREFDQWLVQGLSPAKVYDQMPIGRKLDMSLPFLGKSRWPFILSMLEDWLEYVEQYRYQFPDRKFSDYEVIEVLVGARGVASAVKMFHELRNRSGMRYLADQLQRGLISTSSPPREALKFVSRFWIKSNLNPADAYRMLPFPVETPNLEAAAKAAKRRNVRAIIAFWIRYVLEYRSLGRDFTKDQVLELLARSSQKEMVADLLHSL
uniref:RXLR phytopathogen effector protein WY-domain domain-containing protein n=1 Tax=Peronospora matthiolae TaxID=2874970 RepID=A0AAV1TWT7_9STRA